MRWDETRRDGMRWGVDEMRQDEMGRAGIFFRHD